MKVIFSIDWDTKKDIPELPKKFVTTWEFPPAVVDTILETMDHDALIEALSDEYGYCIRGYLYTVCS